jgi:thioredoxin reductase (NADPH)
MHDMIIIGAGPAGLTAGIYAARAGLDFALIEKVFPGGQVARTSMVENYPGFPKGISGMDFALALKEQAENLGVEILQYDVDRLELDGLAKKVHAGDTTLEARTVILAMGANPKTLGMKGEYKFAGRGVSYCATCDGAFFRKKRVAVIGGGDTAGEDALYLSKLVDTVFLVHRRNELRMQKHLQYKIASVANIKLVLEQTPEEVLGRDFVTGLRIKNVKTNALQEIPLDGVFVAVGIEPETKLAQDTKIALDNGYILANEFRQTSISGVFAAGDIVKKPLRQVVTAVADGAVAVYSAQQYLTEIDWPPVQG